MSLLEIYKRNSRIRKDLPTSVPDDSKFRSINNNILQQIHEVRHDAEVIDLHPHQPIEVIEETPEEPFYKTTVFKVLAGVLVILSLTKHVHKHI